MKKLDAIVRFRGWFADIEVNHYADERATVDKANPALRLIDQETYETIAVATVNIPQLITGELAIKDYSENEGMLDALIAAGIVEPPHRYYPSGFVKIPIVEVAEKHWKAVFNTPPKETRT